MVYRPRQRAFSFRNAEEGLHVRRSLLSPAFPKINCASGDRSSYIPWCADPKYRRSWQKMRAGGGVDDPGDGLAEVSLSPRVQLHLIQPAASSFQKRRRRLISKSSSQNSGRARRPTPTTARSASIGGDASSAQALYQRSEKRATARRQFHPVRRRWYCWGKVRRSTVKWRAIPMCASQPFSRRFTIAVSSGLLADVLMSSRQ